MLLAYPLGPRGPIFGARTWLVATGQGLLQISSALFLGSMSLLRFRVGRFRILYAIPYATLLVVSSLLVYGVCGGAAPASGPLAIAFPVLGAAIWGVALAWNSVKNMIPVWLSSAVCVALGGLAYWINFIYGPAAALSVANSANFLMAALLLAFVYRRFSPGVMLGVLGFASWSLAALLIFPGVSRHAALVLILTRAIVLAKVVAAVGMILLVLEDELARNEAAQEREHRARRQLEAYANLILTWRRVEDFDRQSTAICETVAEQSRFSQVALLLESSGCYRLAGSAGFDTAAVKALADLAGRIRAMDFLVSSASPLAVERCQSLRLDLKPWLSSDGELGFTEALASPMRSPTGVEGAFLLAGMRAMGRLNTDVDALTADDLLPIELLAAHLQAARSRTLLFEKLIDAEKFSGMGQLADGVTQKLNDPLTVLLGYASMLEESSTLNAQDRAAASSILAAARRIRSMLESLSRLSNERDGLQTAVSVTELLTDVERLYRSGLMHRAIAFQIHAAQELPKVQCDAQQLRQAILQCLQYAICAVERQTPETPKFVRLDAAYEAGLMRITVGHSGPWFPHPETALDPSASEPINEDPAQLELSLCAVILRKLNGRALAVNLQPCGAAIVLELKTA